MQDGKIYKVKTDNKRVWLYRYRDSASSYGNKIFSDLAVCINSNGVKSMMLRKENARGVISHIYEWIKPATENECILFKYLTSS